MTFGQKLQALRKESGLSQEELSYQLGVSRQAVSKWECDSGYPETEKIICISKLFQVSLDDLLRNEDTPDRGAGKETGLYVSREQADGFLLYQRQKFLKIALAAGLMVGSLAFPFLLGGRSILLFMLVLIIGGVLLCSVRITDNPYRKLWKEPLLLDHAVKASLCAAYAEKKKGMQALYLAGITLIAIGILLFPLLVPAEIVLSDAIVFSTGMAVAGLGTFLCIYMWGVIRAYRLLVSNELFYKKGR